MRQPLFFHSVIRSPAQPECSASAGFGRKEQRGAGQDAKWDGEQRPPGGQRGAELRLPLSGQLHGLWAALQGAALRSGQKIAQPAEDSRNGKAVRRLGAPIAPVAAPAHEAVYRDHGPLTGRLRQRRAGGVRKAAELGHDEVSAGRVKSVVPDTGGKSLPCPAEPPPWWGTCPSIRRKRCGRAASPCGTTES